MLSTYQVECDRGYNSVCLETQKTTVTLCSWILKQRFI